MFKQSLRIAYESLKWGLRLQFKRPPTHNPPMSEPVQELPRFPEQSMREVKQQRRHGVRKRKMERHGLMADATSEDLRQKKADSETYVELGAYRKNQEPEER